MADRVLVSPGLASNLQPSLRIRRILDLRRLWRISSFSTLLMALTLISQDMLHDHACLYIMSQSSDDQYVLEVSLVLRP